jgi:hypothetical protein
MLTSFYILALLCDVSQELPEISGGIQAHDINTLSPGTFKCLIVLLVGLNGFKNYYMSRFHKKIFSPHYSVRYFWRWLSSGL